MKGTHILGSVGLVTMLAAYGCSVETKVIEDGAGGAGGDAPITSTTQGPGPTTTTTTVSSGSGMMVPDESTSCADAPDLAENMNAQGGLFYDGKGVINPAEDQDFYKFTAKAGQYIGLTTDANPMDDPMAIDTVITLFTADGKTQLAEIDDSVPRISTDSELFYRVEKDGTYCVQVQEFSQWDGSMPAEGDPSFTYRMIMFPLDTAIYEGYDEDKEPNNDLESGVGKAQLLNNVATSEMTKQIFDQVYGLLDPATDRDVYEFTAPEGSKALSATFTPSGTDGYGSTGGPGLIKVWDGANLLWGQLDYAKGSDGFGSLPISPGKKYFFEVNKPAGAVLGANDFYFFKVATTDTTNPQEADDAGNGSSVGAEAAMAQAGQDANTTLHFLGGTIPAGDTDWWSIEAAMGDEIVVVCSSQRAGSGVADLKVELIKDLNKAALESEVETDAADLLWSNKSPNASKKSVIAPSAGTYFVKLSSTKMITNGPASAHYLCGAHAITP